MAERKCRMCGVPFPEGTAVSKMYCAECAKIRNNISTKKRNEKRRLERLEHPSEKPHSPFFLKKEDKDYCRRCIYAGSFSEDYLCNYFILTGRTRGCKAGLGCERKSTRRMSNV